MILFHQPLNLIFKKSKEKELSGYPLAVERFFQEVMSQEEFREYVNKAVLELERFTDKSPTQSFFYQSLSLVV